MRTPHQPFVPQGGLDDLLARLLPKGISLDEAMMRVHRLYGPQNLSEREWVAIRVRVARLLSARGINSPAETRRQFAVGA